MRGALIIHILFLMSYRHTIPRIDNKTRIMNKDYSTGDFLLVGFVVGLPCRWRLLCLCFWLGLTCQVVVGGGREWRHQGCLGTDMGMWRWEENYSPALVLCLSAPDESGHRFGFVLVCSSIRSGYNGIQ